ncbi:hypothetical protein GGH96_006237 [Coemansia sp. RSA 1972]|nr:hypothetical protein GGH96_006237 [Coemansia sp. RSA 1972]
MVNLELKLQNTEAFVALVGDHSMARAGDTSKYFLRTEGEDERVFVDGCTTDPTQVFAVGGLHSYIEHAVKGGTSALFVSGSGITQPSDYDRSHLIRDICTTIGTTMSAFDPNLSMTYAFLGITDHKVIDFYNDRTVSAEKVARGLSGLHHEVDDWAVLEEKIQKGATLPFVLSLRFESLAGQTTSGHLCIVDMHVVSWSEDELAQSVLQKSVNGLASLVRLMGSDHDRVLTGCTIEASALLTLTGDLLASNSKTAFVFYLNTSTNLSSPISMISTVRKLRTTLVRPTTDRRIQLFYEKAHYYQQEKYRLQASLDSSLAATEQVERDLDDVQQGFSAERTSLHEEVEHWQQKTKELEEALNGLRNECEGAEADARWMNARLVTEKLGLKDELRRMEVEAAGAEDSKTRIMDVHEALVDAHEALDTAYTELLDSYKELRGRCRHLVDVRSQLETQITDLEDQANVSARHLKQLEAQITEQSATHSREISELETLRTNDAKHHSQQVEQLESRLEAQASRLASTIDELAMGQAQSVSQTEETKGLRSTIARLTREISTSEQTTSSELHAASTRASRLEAQVTRLTSTLDEMRTSRESSDHAVEKEQAEWARERKQMQKKMDKLQKDVEQAREQATEIRDVGDVGVSHDKYLALKQKLRQAVEFAADVQAKLDAERPDEIVSDEPVVNRAPRRSRAAVPAPDPVSNTSGDTEPVESDDSEISFNPRAISPITRPQPKPRKPRAKRPARKVADEPTEPTQPVARHKPTTTRNKRTRNGTDNAEAVVSAPVEPTPIVNEPSVPRVSALKKKRKLNLNRMRSLLGMQQVQPTVSLHSVKFSVPKVRAVADEGHADSD